MNISSYSITLRFFVVPLFLFLAAYTVVRTMNQPQGPFIMATVVLFLLTMFTFVLHVLKISAFIKAKHIVQRAQLLTLVYPVMGMWNIIMTTHHTISHFNFIHVFCSYSYGVRVVLLIPCTLIFILLYDIYTDTYAAMVKKHRELRNETYVKKIFNLAHIQSFMLCYLLILPACITLYSDQV